MLTVRLANSVQVNTERMTVQTPSRQRNTVKKSALSDDDILGIKAYVFVIGDQRRRYHEALGSPKTSSHSAEPRPHSEKPRLEVKSQSSVSAQPGKIRHALRLAFIIQMER